MFATALTCPPESLANAVSTHDQVQIALAVADEGILRSLLINCTPPLAQPHQLGSISARISVPVENRRTVDGVIRFEAIACVLATAPDEINQRLVATTEPSRLQREYLKLTRCESELQSLGQNLSLAQAIALLAHAGFSPEQIDELINLPNEAWHKSWWYALDAAGDFTVPFLRMMRTLRYPDGTFTLQFRDHFAQDKPPCFTCQEQTVLIEIKSEAHSFRKTLERINLARTQLGLTKALLICDRITELEAQGYISQGISIYTSQMPVSFQAQSDCTACANQDCPLQGALDSPVVMCRRFCLDATPEPA